MQLRETATIAALLVVAALVLTASPVRAQLPPVPQPIENPTTPAKAVLGKILFWDEQLSSDNTTACGTCHRPNAGGSDVRAVRLAGADGIPNTVDDNFGVPGTIRSDVNNDYVPDPTFGLAPQATSRWSPTNIGAQWASELNWDGKASSTFVDPTTGLVSIASGGALESQSVNPPVSSVEMAHDGRNWSEVTGKMLEIIPLRLATNLPADVSVALAASPRYPALFAAAFGTSEITVERIAFALGAYQRTLVADQTPWDAFMAGNTAALTTNQQAGLALFNGAANCATCHVPPLFTDNDFHNLGLRDEVQDPGRQLVTGNPSDAGKFKTPTLRNVGLRTRYMHVAPFNNLGIVLNFYNGGGGVFTNNLDPAIVNLNLTIPQRNQIVDFIANGLRDQRVAAQLPPFDRPTLRSEIPGNPMVFGPGTPGSGGVQPLPISRTPANVSNPDFKIGIDRALGGANAILVFSYHNVMPPLVLGGAQVNIDPGSILFIHQTTLGGMGPGTGFSTFRAPIPDVTDIAGYEFFCQWFITDVGAPGPGIIASTPGVRYTIL